MGQGRIQPLPAPVELGSLVRVGQGRNAAALRRAALQGISDGDFAEYFEPFTREPIGSDGQSQTAAVALDWLAQDGFW